MNGAGHVFAIRGGLAHLDHDVTLLPTGQWFDVSRHWDPSLGLDTSLTSGGRKEALALLRPEGWKDRRFGMARQATPGSPPTPTWFVDTAVDSGDVKASRDRKIGRLTGILDAIAASLSPAPRTAHGHSWRCRRSASAPEGSAAARKKLARRRSVGR